MTTYGYARVSTDGQTVAAQDAQLRAAGCAKVHTETASGAKTDRKELAKVLRRLDAGDVLMVTRLDRLARSTRDLLNILHDLGQKGVGFKSLADTWAGTTTPHGRLLVTMLAGIAEFERELIRARTGEGRKRAMDRGVRFGRPSAQPHISVRRPSRGSQKALRRPILLGPMASARPRYRGCKREAARTRKETG